MASTRQIEHLERKHNENPEGLTFAPLANAYRNSGQPERAIEILMHGLEHHPKHAPARIVLGRCHLDLGDDAAAESAFALVLDLDKENVVALKALADITERASRFEDASRWLDLLLEADRNNEEAREQLARIHAAQAAAEAAGGEEASAEAWSPEMAGTPSDGDDGADGPLNPAEEVEPVELKVPWGVTELAGREADETLPVDAEIPVAPPPSPWEPPAIAHEVTDGPSVVDFDGLGGPVEEPAAVEPTDLPVSEPVVDEETDALGFAVRLETEDDISLTPAAHNEFQAPDAAAGLTLHPGEKNEFQGGQDDDVLQLRGSEDNEFQRPSDAELLRFAAEEESEEQPSLPDPAETSPNRESLDPRSWFSPAPEESAPSVTSESQPDGTPDLLEEASSFERVAPAESPFEESEPLPTHWGPDGDIEEAIPGEADESPVFGAFPDGQEDSASGLEVTSDDAGDLEVVPGSLLASEAADDHDVPGDPGADAEPADELYPEVLGSDREEAPPVEVEPPFGSEPEAEPAFVATETMAEVYLSQGHRFEALTVYRALLESTPGDVRLSDKVNALEEELERGAQVAAEPRLDAQDGPLADLASYAASATGGQTVKALFRGLLSTKPSPAPPKAPMESTPTRTGEVDDTGREVLGEPTRPAQDSLSLSAIFGEDASPVPPAVGGGSKTDGGEGFSFDSFFGDEQGESGAKQPSSRRPKGREAEEDLDQFHSWLQGLKG